MTTTAWSHLPNAAYIDRILADVKANPAHWNATLTVNQYLKSIHNWSATENAAMDAIKIQARYQTWIAARDAAASGFATLFTIFALIAWDDAGDYLNLSVDQVKKWALLGDHKAALMLPAVLAFEKSKGVV